VDIGTPAMNKQYTLPGVLLAVNYNYGSLNAVLPHELSAALTALIIIFW
jgi:hypothetical protein